VKCLPCPGFFLLSSFLLLSTVWCDFVVCLQEKEESKLLVSSMAQIEETKKKTRELLCHMMPSHVAKELLAGRDPTSVCEVKTAAKIWANPNRLHSQR